jgi:hypothetical protein
MSDLTPEARLERAKRTIAEGVIELVEAKLELVGTESEWIDQSKSPLGRRRHRDLARLGKLPSKKLGKRILIRRSDINAFLDREALSRGDTIKDTDDVSHVVEELLKPGKKR